jgi:hypothetical protein
MKITYYLIFTLFLSCGKKDQQTGTPPLQSNKIQKVKLEKNETRPKIVNYLIPEISPNYYENQILREKLIKHLGEAKPFDEFVTDFYTNFNLTNFHPNFDGNFVIKINNHCSQIHSLILDAKSLNHLEDYHWTQLNENELAITLKRNFSDIVLKDLSFNCDQKTFTLKEMINDLKENSIELIISTPYKTKIFYLSSNINLEDALKFLNLPYSQSTTNTISSIDFFNKNYNPETGKWNFINLSGNLFEKLVAGKTYSLVYIENDKLNIHSKPSKQFFKQISGKKLQISNFKTINKMSFNFSIIKNVPNRIIKNGLEILDFKTMKIPLSKTLLNKIVLNSNLKFHNIRSAEIDYLLSTVSFYTQKSQEKIILTFPKIANKKLKLKCKTYMCQRKVKEKMMYEDITLTVHTTPYLNL